MSMVLSMENKKQTHMSNFKTFYLTLSRWYRMALKVLNSTDCGVEVQASPTGDHPGGGGLHVELIFVMDKGVVL